MIIILKSFALMIFIFSCVNAKEEVYNMPKELVDLAKTRNCNQLKSFYNNNLAKIGSPFVYGLDSKLPKFITAAFWCENKNEALLQIFVHKDFRRKSFLDNCPLTISG
ncbi:MAG: hypothetical protein JNM93_02615, partial [Bacteriovoracaceae bacterium]|nr:hypothetical protein [Bacteriovoracaceae bacterium]